MDSSITAAGRALRAGDPLGALDGIALRDDPPALALRGIAMAQPGDLARARALLRRAARGVGPRETVERARTLPGARARLVAAASLVAFEIALRRGRGEPARAALARAREAAQLSRIAALAAEVDQASRALVLPAARLVEAGKTRSLTLTEVEAV